MSIRRVRASLSGLAGGGRGRLLASVALGWFFILGVRFVLPAVLPAIKNEFHVDNATAGLAVTVLWIPFAVMQLPTGALVDRVGERRLLAVGMLISGGAILGYVVTPTFGLFLLVTAAFALGNGLYAPPRGTLLSRTYADREGAAFGIVLAAGSVGAALFPALAAFVTVRYGWRVALGISAPAFLLIAAALWWWVPEGESSDADGGVRDAAASTLVAIRDRRTVLAVVAATFMIFGFQAVTAFLSTYLVEVKGLTQGTAGTFLGGLFVVGALSQSLVGSAADRFGAPPVLATLAAVSVLPLLALPFVEGSLALGVVSAAIGARMGIGPVSNAYVVGILPADVRGTAWGLLRTGFFTVGSFGSTFVGVLADSGYFDSAFFVIAGLTACGALVYVFLPPRE